MALKIWLPLNGNINNKGLDEVCTAAGTLAYGDGKLGQALYMASPINANGILAPAQEKQVFTAMIWFKTPTYTGTIRYLFNEGRDYNTYGYGVHLSGNQNNIRAFIANASFTNYAITPDTWYHIAIARDADKKIYFYVNGELIETKTASADVNYSESNGYVNIGRFGHSGGTIYGFSGYLNDFRYYDECLSDKQIKEIAKGLVCHYKLEGTGANPNLVTDSLPKRMMESRWSCNSSRALDDTVLFNGQPSLHLYTSTAGYLGLHKGAFPCKPNTKYHATAYVYKKTMNDIPSDRPLRIYFPARETSSGSVINYHHYISFTSEMEAGKWIKVQASFTTSSNTNYLDCSLDFGNASGQVDCWIGTVKLEEGNIETDWIPNISDAEYTNLGYDKFLTTDVSGNGYNAELTGSVTFNLDTGRYAGSSLFTNNTSYLKLPTIPTTGFANSFTISWWSKISDMKSRMAWGFSDGNRLNLFPAQPKFCCNTGDSANNPYRNVGGGDVEYAQYNGAWHHYVMTGDGTDNKLYIDGEYVGKALTYVGLTGTQIYISGWNASTDYKWVNGSLSDFRIYSTVLNDNDIKLLYNLGASVDNKQNYLAPEFRSDDHTLSNADYADAIVSYNSTFTRAIVEDSDSPSGEAMKLECTAAGRGYYINWNVEPWATAFNNMEHGQTYVLSMWVKTNRERIIQMRVECASSQSQDRWTVGTEYQHLVNTFVFNGETQYRAIIDYADFLTGDIIYIHSIKVETVEDYNNSIKRTGINLLHNLEENKDTKIYKGKVEANSFIEI